VWELLIRTCVGRDGHRCGNEHLYNRWAHEWQGRGLPQGVLRKGDAPACAWKGAHSGSSHHES
jgi:hypothetical protein